VPYPDWAILSNIDGGGGSLRVERGEWDTCPKSNFLRPAN